MYSSRPIVVSFPHTASYALHLLRARRWTAGTPRDSQEEDLRRDNTCTNWCGYLNVRAEGSTRTGREWDRLLSYLFIARDWTLRWTGGTPRKDLKSDNTCMNWCGYLNVQAEGSTREWDRLLSYLFGARDWTLKFDGLPRISRKGILLGNVLS